LIPNKKGWLTVKKLIVLAVVAGVLGLSGLGCNKGDTKSTSGGGATKTGETKSTKAS
jgi:hypothetical protein